MQELNHIIMMVDHPSGAERQLELHRKFSGDLKSVVKALAVPRD